MAKTGLNQPSREWRVIASTFTPLVVVNTVAETEIYSATVRAGLLLGRIFRVHINATWFNQSGLGQGYTIIVRLGGVILFQDITINFASAADQHVWTVDLALTLLNNDENSQRLNGTHCLSGIPAAVGTGNIGDINNVFTYHIGGLGAANMAAQDQDLAVSIIHTNPSPNLSLTRNHAYAEVLV